MCKLCRTELKDNFKKDTAMLQISEIVKKTEEMFDLFNEQFYYGKLPQSSPYPCTGDAILTTNTVSIKPRI